MFGPVSEQTQHRPAAARMQAGFSAVHPVRITQRESRRLASRRSARRIVAIHLSFLHHEGDALGHGDVGKRIARNRHDVRKLARRDCPDGFLQPEQGRRRGHCVKCGGRCHPVADEQGEFLGITAVRTDGRIGAERYLHSGANARLNAPDRAATAARAFAAISGGYWRSLALPATYSPAISVGTRKGATLLHHADGLFVEKRPVFDGVDAGADGHLGARGRRARVRRCVCPSRCASSTMASISACVICGVSDGVAKRQHAAGRAHLDHVRAVLDLKTNRVPELVRRPRRFPRRSPAQGRTAGMGIPCCRSDLPALQARGPRRACADRE